MQILYYAHSGLRYLVLLVGLVALAYFVWGLATRRAAGRGVRALGAAFGGLLDLQVLLGLVMLVLGRYYPQLIGHIVMMVLAAGAVHGTLAVNRRRPVPGWVLPLVGVALGLVLIIGGIMAIQRTPFSSVPFGG
jgi:hypothetical protein